MRQTRLSHIPLRTAVCRSPRSVEVGMRNSSNPNGIAASSPGVCESSSYPGMIGHDTPVNPERVASALVKQAIPRPQAR